MSHVDIYVIITISFHSEWVGSKADENGGVALGAHRHQVMVNDTGLVNINLILLPSQCNKG